MRQAGDREAAMLGDVAKKDCERNGVRAAREPD
jgi:hypothetical protein